MNHFLKLIRYPNLLIIALTICLLQYGVFISKQNPLGSASTFSPILFFLFILYTISIAAAGNIINDIKDVEIDKLNKPLEKQIIPDKISVKNAWIYYFALNSLALILTFILTFIQEKSDNILINSFFITVGLLALYSFYLKKLPLIGNLTIAFLCAYVPFLLFKSQTNSNFYFISERVEMIFIGYIGFAFLSTLFREIIKDIEDIEGDKINDCKTLPIVSGVQKSTWFAFVIGLILLLSVIFFSLILRGSLLQTIILNVIVSLPIIYALFLLSKAKEKEDFSYLSKLAKWIMLGGVVFILIMKM